MSRMANLWVGCLCVLLLVATGAVWAESPSDGEQSNEELAETVEKLQAEVAELKAAKAGALVTPAGGTGQSWLDRAAERVGIHGYVAQGFLYSTDNNYLYADTENGDFQFNEMVLNVFTELSPKISVAVQLFSRDLGAVGNNSIQLDYAFGDYHISDRFGIRAGRIRIPFGLYGDIRDVDQARTSILLPQNIYSETQRDVMYGMVGFGIYGDLPLGAAGSLEYQLQTGSNNIDDQNTAIGYISFGSSYSDPDWTSDHDRIAVGRLVWSTPVDGLRLAGSYFKLEEATFSSTTTEDPYLVEVQGIQPGSDFLLTLYDVVWWTASAEYTVSNLVLAAEYVGFEVGYEDSIWGDLGKTPGDGYYLSARYRVNDWFEIGSFYSTYYGNRRDRDGDSYALRGSPRHQAWSKDTALSLRFDLYEGVAFKVESHFFDGTANLYSSSNDLATAEKDAILFAAKLSYTF